MTEAAQLYAQGKVLFSDDDGREEPASSPGRGTEGRAAEIAASIEPDTSPQKAKEGNQTAGAGLLVPGLVEKATHAPAVGKSEAQVTQPEGSEDNVDAGACAADDSTSQLVDMDSSEAERKGESASVSEGSKGETDAMADQRQDAACGHRAISLKLAVKDLPDADGTAIKQDHPASDTPGASQPTVPTKEATCAETEVAEHQGAEPTSSRSPQTKDVPESLEPIAGNSLQPEDRAVKIPLQDVSPGAPGGGDEMGSATSGSPPSRGEDPTLPESKTAGGALRNRDAAANGGRSGCNKVAPNALTIMGSKGQSSGEDASDAYVA